MTRSARPFPALLATCLATAPALAQIIPTGTPAADILLSRALAEHRVFLTCSTLDPATQAVILSNWQRDVAAATAILQANAVPPEAIAAFTDAARPESLLPAPDTPFEDVRQICAAGEDWQERYFKLDHTILELKLPQALQ
jgi:hypothetical protein